MSMPVICLKKKNQKTNKKPWKFVQIISELEVENMCLSMSPYSSPFYRQELPGEASHYARYVETFAKWNNQVLAPTTAFWSLTFMVLTCVLTHVASSSDSPFCAREGADLPGPSGSPHSPWYPRYWATERDGPQRSATRQTWTRWWCPRAALLKWGRPTAALIIQPSSVSVKVLDFGLCWMLDLYTLGRKEGNRARGVQE